MTDTSLRARKKLETARAIVHAARELVQRHGLDGVTIDEITDAARVSPRTFFNYFPCKEAAVVGIDPETLVDVAQELRDRPADEGPVDALRAVLVGTTDPHDTLHRWQLRNELVAQYPALLPRHLAAMAEVEAVLTRALADRVGADPARNPQVQVLVASVLAALRTGLSWWHASDRQRSLLSVLDDVFEVVAPINLGASR